MSIDSSSASSSSANERDALDLEKLRLEIRTLSWSWARFVTTLFLTAATLTVAYLTWTSQSSKDRQATLDGRRTLLEDRYFKARDTLSSATVPLRINAALDLGAFTRSAKGSDVGEATVDNAVAALTSRITVEDNPDVIRAITAVLGNSSPSSIDQVITVNRLAASDFARLYGEEVGDGRAYKAQAARDRLSDEIAQSLPPIENGRDLANLSTFNAANIAYQSANSFEEGALIQASRSKKDRDERLKEMRHDVAVMAATGIALESLFKHNTGKLRGTDLSGTVLYQVDLTGVDFSGVHFVATYISGDATAANFTDCDLRKAFLSDLIATRATFRHAMIARAFFPDLRDIDRNGRIVGSQADFSQSDWKAARMWLPVSGTKQHRWQSPTWLGQFTPA